MPFPLAIPIAISAIKALIKFRGRLDTILSVREATAPLPFLLPPLPRDDTLHIQDMLDFFELDADDHPRNERGRTALELNGLVADFNAVKQDPDSPALAGKRKRLLDLFYEAGDVPPVHVGPPQLSPPARQASPEMRLAFYVVESQRLSRNPAAMRVLLATADTVLEFAGANAELFIADKRVQGLVATLLDEFAVKRDFDDEGGAQIFKSLLGSAAVAVIKHPGDLPDQPALQALIGALADVRNEMDKAGAGHGTDFVAGFVSADGFQRLVGHFLARAAGTPGLLPANEVLRPAFAAMLKEAAQDTGTLFHDPRNLLRVLESGLAAAAGPLGERLNQDLGGKPLAAAALKSVLDALNRAAAAHSLFRQIQNGELLEGVYHALLQTIATHPELLASAAGLSQFTAGLVSAFAEELSQTSLARAISIPTLQKLAVRGLEQLAASPEVVAGHNQFAGRLLAAALEASAGALQDRLSADDFSEIAGAVCRAAAENLSLVKMDARLRAVLTAFGSALGQAKLDDLTTAAGRKNLLLTAFEAIASDPVVWGQFADRNAVQPIVLAVLRAFSTDATQLLSGPALVPALRLVLEAVARRGSRLIAGEVKPDTLNSILTQALEQARQAIGTGIDAETLPRYLERVVTAFLQAPLANMNDAAAVAAWLRDQLSHTESPLP